MFLQSQEKNGSADIWQKSNKIDVKKKQVAEDVFQCKTLEKRRYLDFPSEIFTTENL